MDDRFPWHCPVPLSFFPRGWTIGSPVTTQSLIPSSHEGGRSIPLRFPQIIRSVRCAASFPRAMAPGSPPLPAAVEGRLAGSQLPALSTASLMSAASDVCRPSRHVESRRPLTYDAARLSPPDRGSGCPTLLVSAAFVGRAFRGGGCSAIAVTAVRRGARMAAAFRLAAVVTDGGVWSRAVLRRFARRQSACAVTAVCHCLPRWLP